MAFTVSDYIKQIQALVQDEPLSKLVKVDDLTAQVDGTRSQFMLSNRNIVPASYTGALFQASVDGAAFANATLTDSGNGIATVSSAPQKSVRFIYYYQIYAATDPANPPPELLNFMNNGLRQIGVDPTNATALADVPQTLFPAPCYLAAAEFLRQNAQLVAKFYNFTAAGKNIQKGDVYKNIRQQADDYQKTALKIRQDFYTEQDRYLKPVIAITSTQQATLQMMPER